jgi:Zn-dependent metalloprotease
MERRVTRACALAGAIALTIAGQTSACSQEASESSSGDIDASSIALDHVLGYAALSSSIEKQSSSELGAMFADGVAIGPLALAPNDLSVSSLVENDHNGTTIVYVQQRRYGIDIRGAIVSVTVANSGKVLYSPGRLVDAPGDGDMIGDPSADSTPIITAPDAMVRAARALDLEPSASFDVVETTGGQEQAQMLSSGGVASSNIPARLVWEAVENGSLQLAWDLMIDINTAGH